MTKVIVTTSIILLASLNFYAKQTNVTNGIAVVKTMKISAEDKLGLSMTLQTCRMDIRQADIK